MVTWTNAILMDIKRSDGTKNILGDGTYMTCDSECGEIKGHGFLNK